MNYKTKKMLLIIFLFFLHQGYLLSQATEWIQRYNSPGNYNDYVCDMVTDKAGNVYLTGYIFYSNPNQDFITLKYNSPGALQWVKIYDGTYGGADKASTVRLDKEGNVYVLGESKNVYGKPVCAIVKYSNLGEQLWVREYINEDSLNAIPSDFTIDDSSNLIVTGYCSTNLTLGDWTTVKYNNDGIFQWRKYFNGTANYADIPYSITTDRNCNIYVTGMVDDTGTTGGTPVVKYDKYGNLKWAKKFTGGGAGLKIMLDRNDYIYISGHFSNGQQSQNDLFVIKCDTSGNNLWLRTYGSTGASNPNDYFRDMTIDDSNNVYICGKSDSIYTGWDYVTLKYSSSGEWKWIRRYNDGNSEVNSITTDRYNNVFVTGKTDGNFLNYKYTTIKYSTEGNLLWTEVYNGITLYSNNSGVRIRTDSLGNAYVTGNSEDTGTGMDIATIKYSAPMNITKQLSNIPEEFGLFQNYPNPFNPVTNIQFDLPKEGLVTLKVYDVLGREVKNLVNEFKQTGSYIVSFDGSELSSGIYFYLLESGDFVQVKRMILIK
jgi:hypothetical protein